jgi:hypothetical protein
MFCLLVGEPLGETMLSYEGCTVGSAARNDTHEIGNLIVALHFCLRQLDGRQRTDELEAVVRRGLEVCEQAIAAVRTLQKTMPACSAPADQMAGHGNTSSPLRR